MRTARAAKNVFESIKREQQLDKELDRMGIGVSYSDAEDEQRCLDAGMYDEEEQDKLGIFNPGIEHILWRRVKEGSDPRTYEYYVKLEDYSYLHCQWVDHEEAVNLSKTTKQKVNRFNKQFDQKLMEKVGVALTTRRSTSREMMLNITTQATPRLIEFSILLTSSLSFGPRRPTKSWANGQSMLLSWFADS